MAHVLTFGNMKGGAGKSTLTMLFANFISNETDLKVAVIDCDDLQQSIRKIRMADLEKFSKEWDIPVKELDDLLYPVFAVASSDLKGHLGNVKDWADIVILDLPGTVKSKAVEEAYLNVDTIIVPACVDKLVKDSTNEFIPYALDVLTPYKKKVTGVGHNIFGLYNKVEIKSKAFRDFLKNIPVENPAFDRIEFIDVMIPDSKSKEIRTDINTVKSIISDRTFGYKDFCTAILDKTGLKYNIVEKAVDNVNI